MIEAYVARIGPNPLKLILFLEEVPVEHRKVWMESADPFRQSGDFMRLSPHGKLPALIDRAPADGGGPIEIFESAAILEYLADKTGALLAHDPRGRVEAMKWVAWQIAALGPTCGQAAHFARYAPAGCDYATDRFMTEARRLYQILDTQLSDRDHIAGDYSIADVACFPWIYVHGIVGIELEPYPNLTRWLDRLCERPAVRSALALSGTPKTMASVKPA